MEQPRFASPIAPSHGLMLWTLLSAWHLSSGYLRPDVWHRFSASVIHFEWVATLLLGIGCALALCIQGLQPRLNRTPLLPGLVLALGTWAGWLSLSGLRHVDKLAAYPEGVLFGLEVGFTYVLPGIAVANIVMALWMLFARRPLTRDSFPRRAPDERVDRYMQTVATARQAQHAHTPSLPEYMYPAQDPRLHFADLYGNDDLKSRLLQAAQAWQGEHKNGILLFGPPGTGKTAFAEALAGELGLRLMKVTFGDLASKWINQSTEQLVLMFAEARQQQPVMLFIDEIDSLLKSRGNSFEPEEYNRLVTTFLDKVVDIRNTRVLVVAATNYIDQLDAAAIREGRMDFHIQVPLPDTQARHGLLENGLQSLHCMTDAGTMQRLARRWGGFNVPRLQRCAEEACKLARVESGRPVAAPHNESGQPTPVGLQHFHQALRHIQGRKAGAPEGAKPLARMFLDKHVSEQLLALATRLRNVDQVEQMGGSLPKGVLFHGLPGTGKTAAAMALAHACDWTFLPCTGRELLQTGAVDKLARQASDLRPAIVFIDEADDILGERDTSGWKSATNELLVLMDGAGGMLHDVVWIAATNHPENMDSAALRGGRFGEKIEFGAPSEATAKQLIHDWIKRKQADRALDIAGNSEDWANHAYPPLAGMSPADIYQVLDGANNLAITEHLGKQTPRAVTRNHVIQSVTALRGA